MDSHKFENHTIAAEREQCMIGEGGGSGFSYLLEVYVDDFMSLVILTSEGQL